MTRTANVFARVEPDVKEQAEQILNELGIPMSNAISMFLRQVVIHEGIPFDVKLGSDKPYAVRKLSKEEFDQEMLKSLDDIKNGRLLTTDEVDEEFKRLYGI